MGNTNRIMVLGYNENETLLMPKSVFTKYFVVNGQYCTSCNNSPRFHDKVKQYIINNIDIVTNTYIYTTN